MLESKMVGGGLVGEGGRCKKKLAYLVILLLAFEN
jgi:hypothetical protein